MSQGEKVSNKPRIGKPHKEHKTPKPYKTAKNLSTGGRRPDGKIQISFIIDEDTLTEVREIAIQDNVSVNRALRQLVEDGLETRKMAAE